ncbi:MAG TPA: hypothetical protein VFO79_12160, partial [Xanthomonadales bacterium]|nr:hypothetical protein [Xanthomonadales bacterium]
LDPASLLVVALEQLGETEAAAAWRAPMVAAAQRWLEQAGEGAQAHFARALIAAMEGNADAAVAALEAAHATGFRQRWLLARDPRLARVRDDPRIRALDQRIATELAQIRAALAD